MNPSKQLGDYFTHKILEPLRESKLEEVTNKEFYLGDKEYEYSVTITGHWPEPEQTPE